MVIRGKEFEKTHPSQLAIQTLIPRAVHHELHARRRLEATTSRRLITVDQQVLFAEPPRSHDRLPVNESDRSPH
jgi:hypothetical protein